MINTLLRPQSHRSPNLCWSPACFPSHPPEDNQTYRPHGFWDVKPLQQPKEWQMTLSLPDSAPSRGSTSDPSGLCEWFAAAGWFSPKWFHQRAHSWENTTRKRWGGEKYGGNRTNSNTTYPHRLRHSRPSSMALWEDTKGQHVHWYLKLNDRNQASNSAVRLLQQHRSSWLKSRLNINQ